MKFLNTQQKHTLENFMDSYQEQLKSIIDQTVPPDEIIICDDQSKDSSVKVAESILKRWHGEWRIFVALLNRMS